MMEFMESVWLYLEPYTFISEDCNYYLFYNSKTKKGVSFEKNESISPVIKELQDIENLYSVKIDIKKIEDSRLFDFIKIIQRMGYGDIIEGNIEKPLVFPPVLNLQYSVERIKEHDISIKENILSYLHEVFIYVNSECLLDCMNCSSRFKQYICCTKSKEVLNFDSLRRFLYSISNTGAAITILGGNIFKYEKLKELIDILEKIKSIHTIVTDWRNIPSDYGILSLLDRNVFKLKIIVNEPPFDIVSIVAYAKKIKQNNISQNWEIIVTSLSEYNDAEILSEELSSFANVAIKPFYNGRNLKFFEEYVYVDQEELERIKLDRQSIFALQKLNTYAFGKINIFSNGKIYANVYNKPIGCIEDSIKDILGKELEEGISWRSTRYDKEPCSECRFNLLCPSISNYEFAIGRINLCHIRD